MLWLTTTVKLLAEVALLALLGQWLLGALVGAQRERNPCYQVLAIVTRPVVRLAQALTGGAGRGAQALAFSALLLLWLLATAAKIHLCLAVGVQACR